jgi:predicted Rossmann-fold nucleotide-binding protein
MSERKQIIRSNTDVIVCLPGSYGTLDEMMDATSSGIVGEHHTPLFALNYKGFYEPLKQQIRVMEQLQFIPAQQSYQPVFVDTLDELYEQIEKILIMKVRASQV